MAIDPAYREDQKRQLAANKKRYHSRNRDRLLPHNREMRRLRKYGLSAERNESLFNAQGRCCAICKVPEAEMLQRHIDHDHVTGRVRGILCGNCNLAIGHMQDDPARLRRAAEYLERPAEALESPLKVA